MYKVNVELKFEAAHRLLEHEGKCSNLHGHSYLAIIGIYTLKLQPNGFVIDFGVLKSMVGNWIDTYWDHATILHEDDPLLPMLKEQECNTYELAENPTAERMAQHLYKNVYALFHPLTRLVVSSVTIYETATSWAVYMPDL